MKSEDDILLQNATGWAGPRILAVTNHAGKPTREYSLEKPFALIGHSEQCDIPLTKGHVAYRHAYLQWIGGQLLVVDCGTELGTVWEAGPKKADWLTVGRSFRVAGYTIQLAEGASTASGAKSAFPFDFNPLKTYRDQLGRLPKFEIEFRNAQIKQMIVPIGHMLTLIGRHRSCKFHFDDESVSHVHASLLVTAAGLWIIDLLGRDGTNVNGNPVRFALVGEGDDLQIGRYRMKVRAGAPAEESVLTEDIALDRPPPVAVSTILINSNKIFVVQQAGDALIVTPEGSPNQFRYADVHHEANRVLNLLGNPDIKNLIIDLGREENFTSVAFGVFNRLRNAIRVRGGRVALCNASDQMQAVLREKGMYGLWQHFPTREEGLNAFHS